MRLDESAPLAWEEISGPCMRTDPEVSVIMPVYNHAPYLAEAIEGVIGQRARFPLELIIGNDASSDGSLAVALEYQRNYPETIRILTSETNVGMHSNVERLIGVSRGRYLAFCEGDDYWHRADKLELQVNLLVQNGWGAVHSDFTHIRMLGGSWRALEGYWRKNAIRVPSGDIFDELLGRNFVMTCTLVGRADLMREFVISGLSWKDYSVVDWPLCLFVSSFAPVGFVDESLATYRMVPGSATNSGARAALARARSGAQMLHDFSELLGVEDLLYSRAENQILREVRSTALAAGDLETFRQTQAQLRSVSPSAGPDPLRFVIMARLPCLIRPYLRLSSAKRMARVRRAYVDSPLPPAGQ